MRWRCPHSSRPALRGGSSSPSRTFLCPRFLLRTILAASGCSATWRTRVTRRAGSSLRGTLVPLSVVWAEARCRLKPAPRAVMNLARGATSRGRLLNETMRPSLHFSIGGRLGGAHTYDFKHAVALFRAIVMDLLSIMRHEAARGEQERGWRGPHLVSAAP